MKSINRFGEIYYDKNEAVITMPFNRLTIEEPELLEENYLNKIKEMSYPDTFIYANHFSSIRDRLQISFDLDGCMDFHQIHKYKLRDMLPYLYSMVELSRQDVNILWQKANTVLDLNEQRVKVLIFNFEGFQIYKRDNNIDGLKELILLSLTNRTSIIAKPKRADFIEQTADVFQFSDDIIAAKSVDEMEAVIKAYEREIEYRELKAQQLKEEKMEQSKLFALKEKIKPKKKGRKPDEVLKEKLNKEMNNKGDRKQSSGNFVDKLTSPVAMISIIGVLVVFGFLFTATDLPTGASEQDGTQKDLMQKEQVLEAYRLYISGGEEQKEQAFAKLDSIGYSNLPQEDKSTLMDWYIQQGQYTKALTIEPNSAYKVSNAVTTKYEDKETAKSELETLEASFPDNKVLKFDIANLDDNNQMMVENSELSKYNDVRAKNIVKAYVLTNQLEELDAFIAEYKEDEDSYETLQRHYDQYVDKYKTQKRALDDQEELKTQLKEMENAAEGEDDREKKEDLKSDIKDIKKQIEQKTEEIKKMDESIKGAE